MGAVYLALDERLDRRVALKQIRPDRDRDPALRERLHREARAAARLSHPNIVQVYDIVLLDDDWIVMEFAEGEMLKHRLAKATPKVPQILTWGLDIAKGLAAAHAEGVIHRDLKAENVIITRTGQAKILDFGIAKLGGPRQEATLSKSGQLVGTPHAMSPEQAKGLEVDHRSDLFSLGTLLYAALTGDSPFGNDDSFVQTLTRICVHQQTQARIRNPQVSTELSDLIDRLLEKDPNHRPQSAEEVVVALQRITGAMAQTVKILFVDDEPAFEQLIRQRYRKELRAGEIQLEFAVDGLDALRKLDEDKEIALVMSDIRMPGLDGLTLLSRIRDLSRSLITVIISAYGDMDNIRTAMSHGAFDFLLKPIDFEDLERTRQKATAEVLKIREREQLREENQLLDERNRLIRDAFGRYLSGKDLANLGGLLQDPGTPGRKRDVTVVKASFQGFADLPQTLPAADLHKLLNRLFSTVVGIVLEHGGILFEFHQGEMLVSFGLPVPRYDDAQRAVDCATRLRRATKSISGHSLLYGGPSLTFRAGIDSGEIDVGREGSGTDEGWIFGPAVARAAQIESSQDTQRILVSETTIELYGLDLMNQEGVEVHTGKPL